MHRSDLLFEVSVEMRVTSQHMLIFYHEMRKVTIWTRVYSILRRIKNRLFVTIRPTVSIKLQRIEGRVRVLVAPDNTVR